MKYIREIKTLSAVTFLSLSMVLGCGGQKTQIPFPQTNTSRVAVEFDCTGVDVLDPNIDPTIFDACVGILIAPPVSGPNFPLTSGQSGRDQARAGVIAQNPNMTTGTPPVVIQPTRVKEFPTIQNPKFYLPKDQLEHILRGHTQDYYNPVDNNASQSPNLGNSLFPVGTTVQDIYNMIEKILKRRDEILAKPSEQGKRTSTKWATKINGQLVELWIELPSGKIITIFPKS
jgi:hypothetical protein